LIPEVSILAKEIFHVSLSENSQKDTLKRVELLQTFIQKKKFKEKPLNIDPNEQI